MYRLPFFSLDGNQVPTLRVLEITSMFTKHGFELHVGCLGHRSQWFCHLRDLEVHDGRLVIVVWGNNTPSFSQVVQIRSPRSPVLRLGLRSWAFMQFDMREHVLRYGCLTRPAVNCNFHLIQSTSPTLLTAPSFSVNSINDSLGFATPSSSAGGRPCAPPWTQWGRKCLMLTVIPPL